MAGRSPTMHHAGGTGSRLATVRARLREPAALTIIAVAFIVSAVGQAVVQRYVDDDSMVATVVLSVLASIFLAAAVIVGAHRHEQQTRSRRRSDQDAS